MNRARVGSALFFGLTLLFLAAPSRGLVGGHGDTARGDDGASRTARSAATPASAPTLANAGLEAAALKAVAAPEVGTTGRCPDGMLEVEGDYCPEVEQRCSRWIDPEGVFPRRCAEFAPTAKCATKTSRKHFCIDRYEWPNKAGENPVVMKNWYEAKDACAAAGKRLCGGSEWTVACEGQERLPYPYGYQRSSEACNIDKPHPDVNERALGSADPTVRDSEVKRLWQGEPSGARSSCVSPYGVFDMTGNVDEWVMNESGKPYLSGLKGGYWGPVRDRCRPMTTIHNEGFSFYQIGFRCCADVPAASGPRTPVLPTPTPASPGPAKVPSANPAPSAVFGS